MVGDEELKKVHFALKRGRGKVKAALSYLCYKIFNYFYHKKNKKKIRFINIHGETTPSYFCDNKIRSTKYTILTFIPLFLIYQFIDVLNLFYLCVSLLQIIPIFNTGYVFTFIAPLIFIITVSLINEIVDDSKRFIKDLENNNEIYYTLSRDGNFKKMYSKNIKVGDIILIKSKQRVPADCILLKNLNKHGDYLLKKEEKKSFCKLKLNKNKNANANVYNKVNKNYYHFNKNIDTELMDDRFNESTNTCVEPGSNFLLSKNERKRGRGGEDIETQKKEIEDNIKENENGTEESLLLLSDKWIENAAPKYTSNYNCNNHDNNNSKNNDDDDDNNNNDIIIISNNNSTSNKNNNISNNNNKARTITNSSTSSTTANNNRNNNNNENSYNKTVNKNASNTNINNTTNKNRSFRNGEIREKGNRKKQKNGSKAKTDLENYTYVKTDKIDGETDWKIKYPINIFQNIKKLSDFFLVDILFVLEEPKNDIYNVEGSYVLFKPKDFREFENENDDFKQQRMMDDFPYEGEKYGAHTGMHNRLSQNNYQESEQDIEDEDEEEEVEKDDDDNEDGKYGNFRRRENEQLYEEKGEEDLEERETREGKSECEEERSVEKKMIGGGTENSKKKGLNQRNDINQYGRIYASLEKRILSSSSEKGKHSSHERRAGKKYLNGVTDQNLIGDDRGLLMYTKNENSIATNSYLDTRNECILYNKNDHKFYDIKYKKRLNYDNIILFNSVITSSDVICLVIYTGSDTRVNMSTQISKIKKGMIGKKLNIITIFLFLILSIFSLYMCSIKYSNLWYLNFVRFVLLFSSVIPISLSINLNVAKIYYTLLIQNDKEIKTTIIKNNSVIEDLGDVDFLFTDKTGTLTENVMILKVIHFGLDVLYTEKENEKKGLRYKKGKKNYSAADYTTTNFLKGFVNDEENLKHDMNGVSFPHSMNMIVDGNLEMKTFETDRCVSFHYKEKRINKKENFKMRPINYNDDYSVMMMMNNNNNSTFDIENGSLNYAENKNLADLNKMQEKGYGYAQEYGVNTFNEDKYEKGDKMWFSKKEGNRYARTAGTGGGRAGLDVEGMNNKFFSNGTKEHGGNGVSGIGYNRRKGKVESIVDEYLKKCSNGIYDYYNDDIDDMNYLKKHRVFQTFLSFLLCNNIRTLAKESEEKDEREIKKKRKRKEKGLQKNLYYILNVSGIKSKSEKRKTGEKANAQNRKTKVNIMEEEQGQDVEGNDEEENVDEEEEAEEEQEEDSEEGIEEERDYGESLVKNRYASTNTNKKYNIYKSCAENLMDFDKNDQINSSDNSETFSHGDVSYQCSSPDELAFLKYATSCGFILKKKTDSYVKIQYKNITFEYDVLLHIPFSSETKRMSVFVRNKKNRNIYFFIKGADNILIKKCHEKYKTFIYEESDYLSNLGLRVLVHGVLNIEETFFKSFFFLYNEKKDVKGAVDEVLNRVEEKIKVLAITGVEDKLQQGVGKTIEMLYNSGIKVWVLTGDKIETAICACKNANIKKKKNNVRIFRHEQINNTASLIRAFNSIINNIESYVLFFDNITIQNCIRYMPDAFADFAVNARAVVCCRCSPIEKKEIALLIKNIKKKKVLCIGDGGNDVAMIQAADIGIGVLGREGKQVVHDSDIIVSKFKNIKKLILYYGNNTFLQTSSLCSFLIHRGFILTYLQFIYSYVFFFIPVSIFQGWLQIGYTTYYTTAPFLSLLLDIKIKKNLIYLYPEIYKNKKHKRKLDLKSFFTIVWISIFQGTVVMLGALKLFNDSYTNLINISFSSLIILEIMNIHLEVESWHPLMISANICSFIVYIMSMFILRNYFDVMAIMSVVFWYKVILIVLFAWLPFYLIKKIKNFVTPSQFFKLA